MNYSQPTRIILHGKYSQHHIGKVTAFLKQNSVLASFAPYLCHPRVSTSLQIVGTTNLGGLLYRCFLIYSDTYFISHCDKVLPGGGKLSFCGCAEVVMSKCLSPRCFIRITVYLTVRAQKHLLRLV